MSSLAAIANEAGVSVATVSLVANNKGSISPATRKRIKGLIDRHQFTPRAKKQSKIKINQTANLETGLGTICIVSPRLWPEAGDPAGVYNFWAQALQGEVLRRRGNFSFLTGELVAAQNLVYQQGLEAGLFQGVILMGVEDGDGYIEAAMRSRVPIVVINRTPEHGEFHSVGLDNFDGGRLVAEHLINLGHRRVGMFGSISQSVISRFIEARRSGFLFGLKSHGIKPAFMVNHSPGHPDKPMDDLVKKVRDTKATGVFLSNDHQAIHFISRCERQGLSVPRDLSVVGFDHADVKTSAGLRLTTISHDTALVASRAVKVLEDILQGRGGNTSESVPVSLVVGDTTQALRS